MIVNNANLNLGLRLGSGVITRPAMNQPAERFTNQSDAKVSQISKARDIKDSVAASLFSVNQNIQELLTFGMERRIMPQVYAAERDGERIIPLSMYRALAGQILVKKAMESLPEEERTVQRLAEAVFGQDFKLESGRAYFLLSHADTVWTLAGTPLSSNKQVLHLRKGWNGVGLPAEKTTTAVQILDDIQSAGEVSQTSLCEICETAEQVARWDWGLWDVVVKRRYSPEHHEIYGRDFPIRPEEGYFIHANEDVRFR